MLNFEIFINTLVENSKAKYKPTEEYGQDNGGATAPNLYIAFVELGNPCFTQGSFKYESCEVTLTNYRKGDRHKKGSKYFPIIDKAYKLALKDNLQRNYAGAVEKMRKLIDTFWCDEFNQKRTYVARMLQYYIEGIDEGGKKQLLLFNKSQLMENVKIPFEVLLIERWYYVVNNSDSAFFECDDEMKRAEAWVDYMKMELVPYAGYSFPNGVKIGKIEIDTTEKVIKEDGFFDDDEFFSDEVKPNVSVKIGNVHIEGNNNNIAAYTEKQEINIYGGKKDD